MTFREGTVDPLIDIRGVDTIDSDRTQADEASFLGTAVTGQTGAAASIVAGAPAGEARLTGLTGMTAESKGKFLTISGAATGANNGTFLISNFISATSVDIVNGAAVAPDGNNGAITWTEREPYSLQDNIQHSMTDRKDIKGTANHYDAIPVYERPTAVGTDVDKNLTNLISLDSRAIVCTRKFENQAVAATNLLITMTDTANLPHADAVDRTGVPIQDGADAANLDACYTELINPGTGQALAVDGRARGDLTMVAASLLAAAADTDTFTLDDGANPTVEFRYDDDGSVTESATVRAINHTGAETADAVRDLTIAAINAAPTLTISATIGGAGLVNLVNNTGGTAGNTTIVETVADAGFLKTDMAGGLATSGQRIYGYTQAGSSTEPNSVEVKFYSIPLGTPHSTANAYTWEAVQPTVIDIYFPFRERMDLADENCWRTTLTHGIVGDAGTSQSVTDVFNTIGTNPGEDDLSSCLTNLGDHFPFSDLPDATPSICEALNTLNEQIGVRDYTGTVLTDGETITESLQALADAIGSASITRVIERLSAAVNAGTAHTLPGGNTYTLDGTDNGVNMWVFWRKLLRDPGPATAGSNDYAETSVTQITPYTRIKAGDSVNYMILQ